MPLPKKYSGSELGTYIRSQECFYDDLSEREAELILLTAYLAIRQAEGFYFLEHTAWPVVPRVAEAYVPPTGPPLHERLAIAYHRTVRKFKLEDEHGEENVWLGPPTSTEPAFPELSLSEQRGFWLRASDDNR